jgi:bacillopeptidase F (M6 metalloprotease family)
MQAFQFTLSTKNGEKKKETERRYLLEKGRNKYKRNKGEKRIETCIYFSMSGVRSGRLFIKVKNILGHELR